MKKPIYAALDLHSGMSVLGSMDHDGQTQPRMRFATEANILRAEVGRLRRKRRPLYLTMEAGALSRWASGLVRPLVDRLVIVHRLARVPRTCITNAITSLARIAQYVLPAPELSEPPLPH